MTQSQKRLTKPSETDWVANHFPPLVTRIFSVDGEEKGTLKALSLLGELWWPYAGEVLKDRFFLFGSWIAPEPDGERSSQNELGTLPLLISGTVSSSGGEVRVNARIHPPMIFYLAGLCPLTGTYLLVSDGFSWHTAALFFALPLGALALASQLAGTAMDAFEQLMKNGQLGEDVEPDNRRVP